MRPAPVTALALTVCVAAAALLGSAGQAAGSFRVVKAVVAAQQDVPLEEAKTDTTGGEPLEDGARGEGAVADSLRSDRYQPAATPAPGGDVRIVKGRSLGRAGRAGASVRDAGTGWNGHAVFLAAGPGPAALTGLTLRNRPAADWVLGGLDLPSAGIRGVATAPAGHDLSVWPVYTSEWAGFLHGRDAPACSGLAVNVRPGRRPYERPFARLTLLTGKHDRKVIAAEFGRWYWDRRFALSGYFENDGGYAPGAGGRYDIERYGGSLHVPLSSDWVAEAGGVRTSLTREDPHWALPSLNERRVRIRSDAHVGAAGPAGRLDAYHIQSWVESGAAGYAASTVCDGLAAELEDLWTLGSLSFHVERRTADGWLVGGERDAFGAGAEIRRSILPRLGDVVVAAGIGTLDGELSPSAGVSARGGGDVSRWELDAGYRERHPTALERFMRPVPVPVATGGEAIARGNGDLNAEGVASVSALCAWPHVLAGAGVAGEILLSVDPIIPELVNAESVRPVNADNETAASAALWIAAGDTSLVHGNVTLEFAGVDPSGALNLLAPVPVVRLDVEAAMPMDFFERYLRTRLEVGLIHEEGLARGPWRDALEDRRTSISVAVAGTAGSARVFVSLQNVFNTDSPRIPGAEPGERIYTAGLSWSFID
jgi:hypothetical protein